MFETTTEKILVIITIVLLVGQLVVIYLWSRQCKTVPVICETNKIPHSVIEQHKPVARTFAVPLPDMEDPQEQTQSSPPPPCYNEDLKDELQELIDDELMYEEARRKADTLPQFKPDDEKHLTNEVIQFDDEEEDREQGATYESNEEADYVIENATEKESMVEEIPDTLLSKLEEALQEPDYTSDPSVDEVVINHDLD